MKALRARTGLLAVLAVAALATSACSLATPTPVLTPYDASDGVSGSLTDASTNESVVLRNVLLVSSGAGQDAALVGAVANDTQSTAVVTITVLGAAGSTTPLATVDVTVPANRLVQVGPTQTVQVTVPKLAIAPGGIAAVTASTPQAGDVSLQVPVLAPTQQYATETPAVTPTPTVTLDPTATATKKSTKKQKKDAAATPTATATTAG